MEFNNQYDYNINNIISIFCYEDLITKKFTKNFINNIVNLDKFIEDTKFKKYELVIDREIFFDETYIPSDYNITTKRIFGKQLFIEITKN